jgi:hypothetical protein
MKCYDVYKVGRVSFIAEFDLTGSTVTRIKDRDEAAKLGQALGEQGYVNVSRLVGGRLSAKYGEALKEALAPLDEAFVCEGEGYWFALAQDAKSIAEKLPAKLKREASLDDFAPFYSKNEKTREKRSEGPAPLGGTISGKD